MSAPPVQTSSNSAALSVLWAAALIDGLVRAGLRRAVISPGARSTPLTLAALRRPELQCHIIVDERSAGFFALGLARAEKIPAALIGTSGTAIANWAPATCEADAAGAPLILLSADRPPELHDCGANQTMDQIGLFGGHVRAFHQLPPPEPDVGWLADFAARVFARALGPLPGPVHVNVPLREVLADTPHGVEPAPAPTPARFEGRARLEPRQLAALSAAMAGRGLIVCGPQDFGAGFHDAVAALALRLNVPIVADLLSGLRFGRNDAAMILRHPDAVARQAPSFDWVLRFGPAPVGKAINAWLAGQRGTTHIVVAPDGRPRDPDRLATHWVGADPTDLCLALCALVAPAQAAPTEGCAARDAEAAQRAEKLLGPAEMFEGALLRALFAAAPENATLFLGNSLTIRMAEWFGGAGAKKLNFFGNRGLSGIDGGVSTACGLAAARGRVFAALGDLAFLHDLNALALVRDLPLTLLVFDNGGGGIFDHLPHSALPEFERGWRTPQNFDMAALAKAFGSPYHEANSLAEARQALEQSLASTGPMVIRAVIDPRLSHELCRQFLAHHSRSS